MDFDCLANTIKHFGTKNGTYWTGNSKIKTNPPKKTATSGNPAMVKTSSMNKTQRRSYKAYRGQGR